MHCLSSADERRARKDTKSLWNISGFFLKTRVTGIGGCPTPLLCLIRPLTLPLGSRRTSCYSAGNPTFQDYSRETPDDVYAYDFVKELQSRLQSSYQVARNNLVRHKERSKEYHDRNVNTPLFTAGDKVLLHDERIRRDLLSSPWIGPYDIVDIDVNVTLKLPRNKTLPNV